MKRGKVAVLVALPGGAIGLDMGTPTLYDRGRGGYEEKEPHRVLGLRLAELSELVEDMLADGLGVG